MDATSNHSFWKTDGLATSSSGRPTTDNDDNNLHVYIITVDEKL